MLRGLIAVRGRPPDGLSRFYDGIGIAGWRYFFPLVSNLDSLISRGAAIGAIRSPQGVMRPISKSSVGVLRVGDRREALTASGSSAPLKYNASCAGRKLSDRRIAAGPGPAAGYGSEVVE